MPSTILCFFTRVPEPVSLPIPQPSANRPTPTWIMVLPKGPGIRRRSLSKHGFASTGVVA